MKKSIKILICALLGALTLLVGAGCSEKGFLDQVTCNHDYNLGKITREATCDRYGERTYTCKECGFEKTEKIEKIAHTPEVVSETAATCTSAGGTIYKCTICDATWKDATAMLAHSYELMSTVESTCAEKGEKLYKCTLCGDTKTEEMELLPHDYETRAAIAATCTDEGRTESIVCKNCGEISNVGETIPALGHDIDKYGDACTVCGKQYLYQGYSLEEVTAGEKLSIGSWYRIYTTYWEENSGDNGAYEQASPGYSYLQTETFKISNMVGDAYVEEIAVASSYFRTISGVEDSGQAYVDVLIEYAVFDIVFPDGSTMHRTLDENSQVSGVGNCYRLQAASGACEGEHDAILHKAAIEPTCSETGKAAIYVCLDCGELLGGEEIPATGAHEISAYRKNADYHWGICACGYEMEEIAHVVSEEYGSNEIGHWTICEVCGYEDSIVNHDSGEWTTVGEVGKDIKDVLTCSKCGYVINTVYLANVDENGQEIVVELNLNTTTSFNLQLVLGETVINQTGTTGIAGLFFNDKLVMTMEEIAANEFMIPATIFGDATGEQILEFGLYTGMEEDGDLVQHDVSIKFNIVR